VIDFVNTISTLPTLIFTVMLGFVGLYWLLVIVGALDLDELTSLVIALERADTTGAPIAELLETQSEVVQRRRMQRAERLAVEAPVKMMFPNMLILIAVLLIVLGPIFIQLVGRGVV
jgi:tight adherence protein C